ncbi:SNARE-associated protein Snapin-like, partial [Ruditapes philippinarum]|uniref:SNARE-associated protein Snapin-like n=1 Tax=Ruditapes philippinarum TaxID=129788 RepID=UPI00295C2B15
ESQVELRQQIDSLAGDLLVISSSQTISVDLESYVKKLNNSRRRVMLVNNILQNVQERLTKLYNNVSRETARRKVLLDPPGAGRPK